MPMRFRPTVRLRLTLLYGGLFLIAGALLLTLNYFLVRRSISLDSAEVHERATQLLEESGGPLEGGFPSAQHENRDNRFVAVLEEAQRQFVDGTTRELVVQSLIAFSGMALAAMALGWFVAGRVLRPLKDITTTARRLSEQSLHKRLSMQGPHDELRELADTLDDMLARLEAAFESQRNFVSNASHELLTPLSIIRAELDVTLADPHAGTAELRAMAETVRTATQRSERLIQGLLTLARSDRGVATRNRVEIDELVRDATAHRTGRCTHRVGPAGGIRSGRSHPARTVGGQPDRERDPAQSAGRRGSHPYRVRKQSGASLRRQRWFRDDFSGRGGEVVRAVRTGRH